MKPINVFYLLNDSISSAELQQQKASFLKQDSKSDCLTSGANVCNDRSTGVKTRENRYCVGRNSFEDRIFAVAQGDLVVVVDDDDRENKGDFVSSADEVNPQTMATIVRSSGGIVCVVLDDDWCKS